MTEAWQGGRRGRGRGRTQGDVGRAGGVAGAWPGGRRGRVRVWWVRQDVMGGGARWKGEAGRGEAWRRHFKQGADCRGGVVRVRQGARTGGQRECRVAGAEAWGWGRARSHPRSLGGRVCSEAGIAGALEGTDDVDTGRADTGRHSGSTRPRLRGTDGWQGQQVVEVPPAKDGPVPAACTGTRHAR